MTYLESSKDSHTCPVVQNTLSICPQPRTLSLTHSRCAQEAAALARLVGREPAICASSSSSCEVSETSPSLLPRPLAGGLGCDCDCDDVGTGARAALCESPARVLQRVYAHARQPGVAKDALLEKIRYYRSCGAS